MNDKLYNNADSFAMSFDEKWKNVDCADPHLKIIIEIFLMKIF